ncbi:MAG: ice-binding family protein, partial [Pyrinomonadaceae bacterium]
MNKRKTFLNKVGTKTLYLVTLFALAAVAAAGFLLVPTSKNRVSAQDNVTSAPANQIPNEVLTAALNFGTATEFAVFAEKGIKDNGSSKFGGDVGVRSGGEITGLSSGNMKGMLRSDASAEGTFKDFKSSFNYINQLPCTEVADSNLGGKTFTPGVYCLSSADLAGEVVLNSDNANGIFIFRVAGSLTAQGGSGMQLMNEAKAYNVFFLTNDSATVAEGSNFRGSILAKNNINVR